MSADASSTVTSSSSLSSTAPNPSLKETTNSASFTDSNLFMFGLASFAVFLLFVLIFAIYKYRNRDEGTYRIDESKNCGPFAELHMPLNSDGTQRLAGGGSGGAGGKKKRSGAGVRHTNPNKEWYALVKLISK